MQYDAGDDDVRILEQSSHAQHDSCVMMMTALTAAAEVHSMTVVVAASNDPEGLVVEVSFLESWDYRRKYFLLVFFRY